MDDVEEFRRFGFLVRRSLIPKEIVQTIHRATSAARWHQLGIPWIDGKAIDGRPITAVHFPHLVVDELTEVGQLSQLKAVVDALCYAYLPAGDCPADLVQSMYYAKPPGAKGQAWHQDERFTPTRDGSLVTVWIALDPATEDNGCLYVSRGSHRGMSLLPHRRQEITSDFVSGESVAEPADAEPLILEPGDVAFLSGHLIHGSHRNRSTQQRRSLVLNFRRRESTPSSPLGLSRGVPNNASWAAAAEDLGASTALDPRVLAR